MALKYGEHLFKSTIFTCFKLYVVKVFYIKDNATTIVQVQYITTQSEYLSLFPCQLKFALKKIASLSNIGYWQQGANGKILLFDVLWWKNEEH